MRYVQEAMLRKEKENNSAVWRQWYGLSVWQGLRRDALRRAMWRCALCRVLLYQSSPMPFSAIVDHITPHRGDWRLFIDPANLQALCKQCHDGAKRAEESRGWHDQADQDGWPIDPRHPSNRAP